MIKNKLVSALGVGFIALLMAGCSLLDVSPREREESGDLYDEQDGFEYALTGVYLQLGGNNLYGNNTSFLLPEWLVRHWSIDVGNQNSDSYVFSNYTFENNKGNGMLGNVWQAYYKAIAQVNDAIMNLDDGDAVIAEGRRELIEGELYALRGFLHLEVLRYWGPVPDVSVVAETKAIPYEDFATIEVFALLSDTWKTVVDGIERDLAHAEEMLSMSDPVMTGEFAAEDHFLDNWMNYRQNRMNYFATLATKARFYTWLSKAGYTPVDSDTQSANAAENAAHYAWMVYNTQTEYSDEVNTAKYLDLSTESDLPSGGYACFGECLFALDVVDLQDMTRKLRITGEIPADVSPSQHLYQTQGFTNTLYESSSTDWRHITRNMWVLSTVSDQPAPGIMIFRKYADHIDPSNPGTKISQTQGRNQVPVIRMSEMALILMEFLPYDKALAVFNEYIAAKGVSSGGSITLPNDTQGRMDRITKEYNKEFFGEGQFFAFCKRNALLSLPAPSNWALPGGTSTYVLPLPRAQQDFENYNPIN